MTIKTETEKNFFEVPLIILLILIPKDINLL